MSEPITFVEPSWLIFDVDLNAVTMTEFGNLAIFNTRGMAEIWARKSTRRLEVIEVTIRPVTQS